MPDGSNEKEGVYRVFPLALPSFPLSSMKNVDDFYDDYSSFGNNIVSTVLLAQLLLWRHPLTLFYFIFIRPTLLLLLTDLSCLIIPLLHWTTCIRQGGILEDHRVSIYLYESHIYIFIYLFYSILRSTICPSPAIFFFLVGAYMGMKSSLPTKKKAIDSFFFYILLFLLKKKKRLQRLSRLPMLLHLS